MGQTHKHWVPSPEQKSFNCSCCGVRKAEELVLLQDRCRDCSHVSTYKKYKPRGLPCISDLCRRVVFEAEEKRLHTRTQADIDCERRAAVRWEKGKSLL